MDGALLEDLEPIPEPPASGVRTIEPSRRRIATADAERERSFRALYDAHFAFVGRNLRRLGVGRADLEDKVQEVFVVAHRRWEEFVDLGHGPRAWLFQIALRVASDTRRHRRRHPVDADGGVAQERQSVAPTQASEIDRRERIELLDRALSTLEVGRRIVIVLHEIEQMSAPEIARALDVPVNTVYSRIRVGRAALERALRDLQSPASPALARRIRTASA